MHKVNAIKSAPVPAKFAPTTLMIMRAAQIAEAKKKLDVDAVQLIPTFLSKNIKLTVSQTELLRLLYINNLDLNKKNHQDRLTANYLSVNPSQFMKDLDICIQIIIKFSKSVGKESLSELPKEKSFNEVDEASLDSFTEHRKYLSRKPSSEDTTNNPEMELLRVLSKSDFSPNDYIEFIGQKLNITKEPSQQGSENDNNNVYSSDEQKQLDALASVLDDEYGDEDSHSTSPDRLFDEIGYYLDTFQDESTEKKIDDYFIKQLTQFKKSILGLYSSKFIEDSLQESGVDLKLVNTFMNPDNFDDLFTLFEKTAVDHLFEVLNQLLHLKEQAIALPPDKIPSSGLVF